MLRILITSVAFYGASASAQSPTITPVAEVVRGAQVTVQGTVRRIADEDEFILADSTGAIEVYLGPNRVPVAVGEAVAVSGYVDDDPGPPELCASRITRANGAVIPIHGCDD